MSGGGQEKDGPCASVGDKEIEGWRGAHCGFSMWEEDVDSTRGEIVPEQFQKDHDVWAQVS